MKKEYLRFGTLQNNPIFSKMDGTNFTLDECTLELGFIGVELDADRYAECSRTPGLTSP